MHEKEVFCAPWGGTLKLMTFLCFVICLGVSAAGFLADPGNWALMAITGFLPLGILAGGAFFMIRGYRLRDKTLEVLRPGWVSTVNLEGLLQVYHDPEAMSRSLRTCGNGGLFAFCGHFRNKTLGPYRAFVTDFKNAVVLRLPDKPVVISPGDPEGFVKETGALLASSNG